VELEEHIAFRDARILDLEESLSRARRKLDEVERVLEQRALERRALEEALEERVRRAASASAPASGPLTLDDGAATHLYRIAQEAFTNAIRHGRVTHVTIELATAEGTLTLSVQDNGRGFDERNASNNGMGMKLMRYRAQMLGGDVTIGNNKGGGVVVRCSCPHRAPSAGDPLPRGGFPLKD
jgi:signal transduction histidine kinase